jgi:hypothetical protein
MGGHWHGHGELLQRHNELGLGWKRGNKCWLGSEWLRRTLVFFLHFLGDEDGSSGRILRAKH